MRRLVNKYWKQALVLGDVVSALVTQTAAYRMLSWMSGYEVSGAKMYLIQCPVTVTKARTVKETFYFEGTL